MEMEMKRMHIIRIMDNIDQILFCQWVIDETLDI